MALISKPADKIASMILPACLFFTMCGLMMHKVQFYWIGFDLSSGN